MSSRVRTAAIVIGAALALMVVIALLAKVNRAADNDAPEVRLEHVGGARWAS